MAPAPRSAGLLLHRAAAAGPEVLIAHMGGPFWARKDEGAWSIPKGEYDEGEEPARRGVAGVRGGDRHAAAPGDPVALGEFRQPSGKRVSVFALEGDLDVTEIRSNEFEIEWPRGSGRMRSFPEIDRAEWMTLDLARTKLLKGQVPALDALVRDVLGPAAGHS